jgi:hypothetical protein
MAAAACFDGVFHLQQGGGKIGAVKNASKKAYLHHHRRSQVRRVTLVRHGQSTWNEEGRIQGSSDFSVLTNKGEGQAEVTRKMLQVRVSTGTSTALFVSFLHLISPATRRENTSTSVSAAPSLARVEQPRSSGGRGHLN